MNKTGFIHHILLKLLISVMFFVCLPMYDASAQLWGNVGAGSGGKANGTSACASDAPGGGMPANCEKKTDCNNSTCQLTLNAQGHLSEQCPSGKRYDVDPNCVMNKNASAGSCMDTMPVEKINRVAETNCYRANGAGGNPKPRNHLGTDYASAEGTVITAAADGTIVWAKPMGGAGRTIVMEHEKKCPCSGKGCDNKYITVYMHMSAYIAGTGGSVKKGTPIGYVGGSNYNSATGELCDAGKGTLTCHPYGPHLHFEIHSGSWNKGYASLKSSIINPLCDDIQSFCGGCSNNVQEECTNKTNTNQWTSLNECAKQEKTVNNPPSGITSAIPGEGGSVDSNETWASGVLAAVQKCDYHNFMLDDNTCFFCPLFKTLFNVASALALRTYNALKDAIANVVIVGFAIWVALFVLRHVSSLEVKKPSKMLQELLVQTFRVLIVVIILKVSYAQILRLTIAPVFDTASNYIQTLMEVECSPSASFLQDLDGFETELDQNAKGALPVSMGRNILCSMKALQDGVWRMIAFGRESRCVGWHIKKILLGILPNLSYVFTGDFLIVAGFILLVAFPWCLVDCVLNMAVAIALLPAAIGAWAFKSKFTSPYLTKIWNFFMNAIFQFVFLSIILYIIITVANQFLQEIEAYGKDYEAIIDPIHGLAFWSVNGLKLMMVCLLGWVFLDNAKELADQFASAPGLNIGRSTGTFFAQAAEKLAIGSKEVDGKGKPTGKRKGGALGILKGGAEMGKMMGQHYVGTPFRRKAEQLRSDRIKNKFNAENLKDGEFLITSPDGTKTIKNKQGKIIGTMKTDSDGNTVYERKKGIFGTQRVVETADGKMTYSRDTQKVGDQLRNWSRGKLNNARVDLIEKEDERLMDKFNDPNANIRTEEDGTRSLLDKNGNVLASMKMNADGTRSITNKHGTSVYDAKGNLISAQKSYRNPLLFGHEQTLSINNGGAQVKRSTNSLRAEFLRRIAPDDSRLHDVATTYAVKRERDLSAPIGKTQSVTKDHLVSIRDIKDENGNVIQQDVAFRPEITKYLIDTNGHLNTQMISQMLEGTQLSEKQIHLAIANHVLKDRNINLANKFFERETSFENGKLTVTQRNLDGTITNLTTQIEGNQMLIVSETADQNGNITQITDNGVMNRVVSKKDGKQATVHYGFNSHIRAKTTVSKLIDENGNFANTIDENEAMWGFTDYDRQLHAEQVRTGKNQHFDMRRLHANEQPSETPQA